MKPFDVVITVDPNASFGWDGESLSDMVRGWVSNEIEKEVRKGVREQLREGYLTGIIEALVKQGVAHAADVQKTVEARLKESRIG